MKIGFAKDIHQLVKNQHPLVLGGVKIDSSWSIQATSDGDIVLHAITSALLGALGLKTLGEYFPESDAKNHKRNSADFLNFALQALTEQKLKIESLDLCIICEQIILKEYLQPMRLQLQKMLGIEQLGIKCTRFEQPENSMIECYCNLLLK